MHIAIDGTTWGGEETGVAAITRRWIQNSLPRLSDHRITAFVSREFVRQDFTMGKANLVEVIDRAEQRARRVAWQQTALPWWLRRIDADVLYCPSYTMPLATAVPAVVTVHDLIASQRPDLCTLSNVIHLRTLVRATAWRAAAVTTPTEVVARHVRHEYGLDSERVKTIPWWCDAEIPLERAGGDASNRGTNANTEPGFVLFVGAIEAKKNLLRLIEAADRIGVKLVMAGPSRQSSRLERQVIARLRRGGHEHRGFVSPDELARLYSQALALAIPSHVEGFGLPALEAMAAGCPVVASTDPALREVCGDAALHVPAEDTTALAKALSLVVHDPEKRVQMRMRGIQRVHRFDADRSAAALVDLLQRVAREHPARRPSTI